MIVVAVIGVLFGVAASAAFVLSTRGPSDTAASEITQLTGSTTSGPTSTASTTTPDTIPPPSTAAPTVATAPDVALSEIVAGRDVAGFVGPVVLEDGTKVAVIARNGRDVLDDGTVELAVERVDGWHIEEILHGGIVNAPVAVGDLTGDAVTEIVVSMSTMTVGQGWDVMYRVDSGPRLREVAFDTDTLEAAGISAFGLRVDGVSLDRVDTTITTCTPSCVEDAGQPVRWTLDRSGTWTLRPDVVDVPSDCTSNSLLADTGIAATSPGCADGWAVGVQPGCDGECEGAEVYRLEDGQWTYVGYHYAVCAEALASETGMPFDTAMELAWMTCADDGASNPTTASPSSTLRRGDSSQAVTDLQRLLVNLGYNVPIDGTFGPGTEAAIREFQNLNGLEADGIAGPATFAALDDAEYTDY